MTKSIFYTIWPDILKMCNNRFYLSYHQSLAKRKNLLLVTYRLPFITLAFSFVLGNYCRIPPEFSASFSQLWVNPILTHMHPTHTQIHTHTHTHTQNHTCRRTLICLTSWSLTNVKFCKALPLLAHFMPKCSIRIYQCLCF